MERLAIVGLLVIYAFLSLSAQETRVDTTGLAAKSEEIVGYFYAGEYQQAIDSSMLMLDWVDRAFGQEHIEYGTWLDNVGVFLHHGSKLKEAAQYLEAGVIHADKHLGRTHEDYATRLNNLGMLYLEQGKLAQGLLALTDALKAIRSAPEPSQEYIGILVNNVGLAYEGLQQYDKTLTYYREALKLTEAAVGKEHFRYGIRLNNLAGVFRNLGQLDSARIYREQSLINLENALGKTHSFYQNTKRIFARDLARQSLYEEAMVIYDDVVNVLAETVGKESYAYYCAVIDRSQTMISLGRYEEALTNCDSIHYLREGVFSKELAWSLLYWKIKAAAYEYLEAKEQAAAAYREVAQTILETIDNDFKFLNRKDQLAYSDNLTSLQPFLCRFVAKYPEDRLSQLLFDITLNTREASLAYHHRMMSRVRASNDEEVLQLYDEWQALQNKVSQERSLPIDKRSPSLTDWEDNIQKLERALASKSYVFQELRTMPTFAQVQGRLNEEEALITFIQYQQKNDTASPIQYAALITTQAWPAPRLVPLFTSDQLTNLTAIRQLYQWPRSGQSQSTLSELIWQPLAEQLPAVKTLHLVPSGVLNQINLAAIPTSPTEILAEKYEIHLLSNARQILRSQTPSTESPLVASAQIYGGVNYESSNATVGNDQQAPQLTTPEAGVEGVMLYRGFIDNGLYGDSRWPYLGWSNLEVDTVANLLKQREVSVELYKGENATEDQIKAISQATTSPAILHLATHGFFYPKPQKDKTNAYKSDPEPMIRSGLVMAGANAIIAEELDVTHEDGILTAYEVSLLDLHETELVVLSACDTALGEVLDGEGVFGLQRAFKLAGADKLIMSLWNVSDQQTYQFMTTFYSYWNGESNTVAAAFYQTQQELKEKYSRPFNPSFWAGFILVE